MFESECQKGLYSLPNAWFEILLLLGPSHWFWDQWDDAATPAINTVYLATLDW